MAQGPEGSAPEEAGVSWFPAVPLRITAGVDLGYDDHVLGSNATTGGSGQGSLSVRENLVLTYDRPAEPTEIRLIGVGRFTQFLDAGTDDKDLSLTLAFTHNFSHRLSLRIDLFAAYQTEPNFQSNIGPENVRAPHFDTHDIFSLSYHWLPRLSSVTTYTFERIKYEQTTPTTTTIGIAQDRFQYTLAEGLHFSLTTRTNLILQYQYLIVDYDSAPNNSVTHSVSAGFNHNLTEHLKIYVLAGESFRSQENGGDSMSPNVRTSVAYSGSNHSLSWTTSYGFEQPTVQNASSSITFRTGLNLQYDLTSRIGARASVFYNHSDNQGSFGTTSAGSPDGLQFTVSLNYRINRHFAAHIDYDYTSQNSSGGQGAYSRNAYFAGLTYTY